MFPFPLHLDYIDSIGRALRAVLSPPKGLASHSMYNLLVAGGSKVAIHMEPECGCPIV